MIFLFNVYGKDHDAGEFMRRVQEAVLETVEDRFVPICANQDWYLPYPVMITVSTHFENF